MPDDNNRLLKDEMNTKPMRFSVVLRSHIVTVFAISISEMEAEVPDDNKSL